MKNATNTHTATDFINGFRIGPSTLFLPRRNDAPAARTVRAEYKPHGRRALTHSQSASWARRIALRRRLLLERALQRARDPMRIIRARKQRHSVGGSGAAWFRE